MSGNATLVERLLAGRFPTAICREAAARIAELEAQVLELGKGESREWVKTTQLDELQNRIAELEAEIARLTAELEASDARYQDCYDSRKALTARIAGRAALSDPSGETKP